MMTTTNEPTETINNYNVIIDNEVEALDLLTQELTGQAGGDKVSAEYKSTITDIISNGTFDSEVEAINTSDGRGNGEKTNNYNIIVCFDSEVEAIDTNDGRGNAVKTISDIITNCFDSEVEALDGRCDARG